MNSLTLIGMPTAGKTTVGRILAEQTGYKFFDVDAATLIKEGKPLDEVIAEHGQDYLVKAQDQVVLDEHLDKTIVSTPGSVIYGDCLAKLKELTTVVFLDITFPTLLKRLKPDTDNFKNIIGLVDGDLERLYTERNLLYEQWCDIKISCGKSTPEEVAAKVLKKVLAFNAPVRYNA